MNAQQLQRRKEIKERLLATQAAAQGIDAPELRAAAERAARELEELLRGVDAQADPLEAGRTWRFLGNALCVLAANKDADALGRAREAFLRAEPLVEAGGDPSDIAKLNLKLADTLRLLSGKRDRAMMEEAKRRYFRSLQIFRTARPSAAPNVEASLQQTEAALRALPSTEPVRGNQDADPSGDEDPEARRKADETNELFRHAVDVLTEQAKKDGVTKERFESGLDVLELFRRRATQSTESPEGDVASVEQMRDIISQFKHIYVSQGIEGARPGSRAAALVPHMQALRGFVFDQSNQRLGTAEQRTIPEFMMRLGHARKALEEAAHDEAATLRVEHDRLRPLAHAIRRAGLRHHLTLAFPFWGWERVDVNPNLVFFAGGAKLKVTLREACAARGLELSEKSKGWGAGQVRWNQLRESAVGVFDLTTEGSELASVCHALGGALTLGVYPVVVVSGEAGRLPFDIDMPPLALGGGEDVAARLGSALDDALYGTHPTTGASSVDETARQVLSMSGGEDATTRVLKPRLEGRTNFDPVEAEELLSSLVAHNSRGKAALLLPIWRGFYPEEGVPRCFHVMPFREPWSEWARDTVREACGGRVKYRRGDETEQQQIIHSIWEEISRATHVVVDLTNLNANVCLELGVAQALGRPTLLLAQERAGVVEALFPEISKLQVRSYKPDDGGASLAAHVASFLQERRG